VVRAGAAQQGAVDVEQNQTVSSRGCRSIRHIAFIITSRGWLQWGQRMQILQAGRHKLLLLELDGESLENVARQAGFEFKLEDHSRRVVLELAVEGRQAPLLLFDAADPGNLGWFSRCQFYVDGASGAVLQTPILVANQRDRSGRALPHAIRLQINKELPVTFRLPNKAPVTEQTVYAVLYSFLNALLNTGVGVCGVGVVKPLAGRTEPAANRN